MPTLTFKKLCNAVWYTKEDILVSQSNYFNKYIFTNIFDLKTYYTLCFIYKHFSIYLNCKKVLNLGYLDPNKTHVARPMEIRTGQQTTNSQTITTQGRKTTTATDNSKTTNQTTATTERAIARKENTTATRV